MRCTVLGSTGFIGSNLAAFLRTGGHEVNTPPRESTEIFSRPLGNVFYCIGLTADFRTRPFDTVRAHVSLLNEILERADFDSLLYLSSTRVYGRGSDGSETAPVMIDVSDPSDLYNLSKLAGESLCRSCGRPGVKVVRLSNVVGSDPASENFLFALIREALSGRITLRSAPDSSKDYILLEEVVTLLPRIALEGKEWLYNVASGTNISNREVVERLASLTGCELEVNTDSPLLSFPAIRIERIRTEFGFSPAPVLDALPKLIADCRAQSSEKSAS